MSIKCNMFSRYKAFVAFTAKEMPTSMEDLVHMAMGISGEAGEHLDAVKKTFAYGKELDTENIIEELGDILFYIQGELNVLDIPAVQDLSDLMELNTLKLTKRYPQGYSDVDAIERKDKVEVGEQG